MFVGDDDGFGLGPMRRGGSARMVSAPAVAAPAVSVPAVAVPSRAIAVSSRAVSVPTRRRTLRSRRPYSRFPGAFLRRGYSGEGVVNPYAPQFSQMEGFSDFGRSWRKTFKKIVKAPTKIVKAASKTVTKITKPVVGTVIGVGKMATSKLLPQRGGAAQEVLVEGPTESVEAPATVDVATPSGVSTGLSVTPASAVMQFPQAGPVDMNQLHAMFKQMQSMSTVPQAVSPVTMPSVPQEAVPVNYNEQAQANADSGVSISDQADQYVAQMLLQMPDDDLKDVYSEVQSQGLGGTMKGYGATNTSGNFSYLDPRFRKPFYNANYARPLRFGPVAFGADEPGLFDKVLEAYKKNRGIVKSIISKKLEKKQSAPEVMAPAPSVATDTPKRGVSPMLWVLGGLVVVGGGAYFVMRKKR